MQRVAGEEQPATRAPEGLVRQRPHREQRETGERSEPGRTERESEACAGAHRWERGQQRVDHVPADALPARVQPAPRVAVAGRVVVE